MQLVSSCETSNRITRPGGKLIEQAQSANFDIAAAVARIVQADAQSKVAGAPLLPAANFTSSATRSRSPGGPERSALTVALNASYEIDFWGRNRATVRASRQLALASRFDQQTVAFAATAETGEAHAT